MSETKKGQRPTDGEAQSRSSEVVTDGPSGLRKLETAMRYIFKGGRHLGTKATKEKL